jgi:hypothetical protein
MFARPLGRRISGGHDLLRPIAESVACRSDERGLHDGGEVARGGKPMQKARGFIPTSRATVKCPSSCRKTSAARERTTTSQVITYRREKRFSATVRTMLSTIGRYFFPAELVT